MNNTQLSSKNLKALSFRSLGRQLSTLMITLGLLTGPASAQEVVDCASCIKKATSLFAQGKVIQASKLLESWSGKCGDSAKFQLLRSTILARRHGFKKEAVSAARKACQLDPESKAAHLQLGMYLMSMKDPDGAAVAFQKLVDIDPSSYEGWSALGQLYTQIGKHEQAKICSKKASCLEPESRHARLKVVTSLIKIGKLAEAKKELKRINLDDNLEPEFYIGVSRLAEKSGAYGEALEAANKVLEVYPNSTETLKTKALCQLWLRRYKKCLETTAKFKNSTKAGQKAHAIETICHLYLGNKKQAILANKKALQLDPNEKLALLGQGIIQFREGSVNKAIESIEESLAENNLFAPAHLALARIQLKLGNNRKALQETQSASRQPQFKAQSLGLKGRVILTESRDAKNILKAKSILSKAFRLDESNPDTLLGKAEIVMKAGNLNEAKNLSEKALAIEPGSVDALMQLAKINDLNGRSKAASKLITRAKSLAPGQGDLIICQAEILINKGSANSAVKLLKANQSKASEFPPIAFKLGKILNQSGDRKKAAKYFKNSLNKGLVGKNAIEARRQIQEIESEQTN